MFNTSLVTTDTLSDLDPVPNQTKEGERQSVTFVYGSSVSLPHTILEHLFHDWDVGRREHDVWRALSARVTTFKTRQLGVWHEESVGTGSVSKTKQGHPKLTD